MAKKWYNYFVTLGEGASSNTEAVPSERSAAQTVAEIASSLPPKTEFSTTVKNPGSFEEIYSAAEIPTAPHGYTIFKIAELLQSEHIRTLPAEVKRSSILLALDAAGVTLREVIEDAVRRDRALDGYERVQQKALQDLEARKAEENHRIQADLERAVTEHRARIQANNDVVVKEKERLYGWRLQKQQEEKKIADAVSYFVAENPITVGDPPAPQPTREPGTQDS